MKLPDLADPLAIFCTGLFKSLSTLGGSGIMLTLAQAIPDEHALLRSASAVTGWGLAIVCIITLGRTVKTLFAKIEEKDKVIAELHETAVAKADGQCKEMLDELRSINHNSRRDL
jgi:hypothetical protein